MEAKVPARDSRLWVGIALVIVVSSFWENGEQSEPCTELQAARERARSALGKNNRTIRESADRISAGGSMDQYIGEIRIFAGNFAPLDWMFCAGQVLPISLYEALYSVIGTTYGGDGVTTFALPNLLSRVPIHQGTVNMIGQAGGAESVTLDATTMAAHSHAIAVTKDATTNTPSSATLLANEGGPDANKVPIYKKDPGTPVNFSTNAISTAGGSGGHENRQPYLAVNFIIALNGIYPPRN